MVSFRSEPVPIACFSIIAGMTMEHYAGIDMWLAAQYQAMHPAPA
jgi:hypothetical protein